MAETSKATILDGINADLGEVLVREYETMYDNSSFSVLLGGYNDEKNGEFVKINREIKDTFRDKNTTITNQGASAVKKIATITKEYGIVQNSSIVVPREYNVSRPDVLLDYTSATVRTQIEEMRSILSQSAFDNIASTVVTANAIVYSARSEDPGTSGNVTQVVVPIADIEKLPVGSGVIDGEKLNDKLTELTTTLSITNDVFGKGISVDDIRIAISPTGNGALSTATIFSNNRFLDDIAKQKYSGAVGFVNASPVWQSIELEFVEPQTQAGTALVNGKVVAVIYEKEATILPNYVLGSEIQTRQNTTDLQAVLEWVGMPMITKPERMIQLVVEYNVPPYKKTKQTTPEASAPVNSAPVETSPVEASTEVDSAKVKAEKEKLNKQLKSAEALLKKNPNDKNAINWQKKLRAQLSALQEIK